MAGQAVTGERPTARLNLLDELYLHLNRDEEPWSVHLEIQVEGRLDDDRLRTALATAIRRHPITRARLRQRRGTDVKYWWEIEDELDPLPLEITDGDREAARREILNQVPDLH